MEESALDEVCANCGGTVWDDIDGGGIVCQICGLQSVSLQETLEYDATIGSQRNARIRRRQKRQLHEWDSKDTSNAEKLIQNITQTYLRMLQEILSISCDRLVADHNFPRELPAVCKQLWLAVLNSSGIGAIDWNERILQLRAEKADMKITKKALFRSLGPQRERAEITFTVARSASKAISRVLSSKLPFCIVLFILYISCRKLLLPVCPSDISSWALSGTVPILSPRTSCQTDLSKLPPSLLSDILLSPRKIYRMSIETAEAIGIDLPAPNFSAFARRYVKDFLFPSELYTIAYRLQYLLKKFGYWDKVDFGKPPDEDLLPHCRAAVVVMMAARIVYKFDNESFLTVYGFEQLVESQTESEQKSISPSASTRDSRATKIWSSWQASVEEKNRNIFASIAYSEYIMDHEMLHGLNIKTTCSMLDTTLLSGEFARPTDIEDISRSTSTILRQLSQSARVDRISSHRDASSSDSKLRLKTRGNLTSGGSSPFPPSDVEKRLGCLLKISRHQKKQWDQMRSEQKTNQLVQLDPLMGPPTSAFQIVVSTFSKVLKASRQQLVRSLFSMELAVARLDTELGKLVSSEPEA